MFDIGDVVYLWQCYGVPGSFLHVNFILTDTVRSGRWSVAGLLIKIFPVLFFLARAIPRKPTTHGELAPPPVFFPSVVSLWPALPAIVAFFFCPFIRGTNALFLLHLFYTVPNLPLVPPSFRFMSLFPFLFRFYLLVYLPFDLLSPAFVSVIFISILTPPHPRFV